MGIWKVTNRWLRNTIKCQPVFFSFSRFLHVAAIQTWTTLLKQNPAILQSYAPSCKMTNYSAASLPCHSPLLPAAGPPPFPFRVLACLALWTTKLILLTYFWTLPGSLLQPLPDFLPPAHCSRLLDPSTALFSFPATSNLLYAAYLLLTHTSTHTEPICAAEAIFCCPRE